jgi:hypothetical protein
MRRPNKRSVAGGAAGIAAGIVGGVALASGSAGLPAVPPPAAGLLDAAHVPPGLTLPGEPVSLRYAIICAPHDDGRPCDGSGYVFLRAGQSGAFRRFPLRRGQESADGRYFLPVPEEIASSPEGFSYYAVLRDDSSGMAMTLPSGGSAAPQVSLRLRKPVPVDLGAHIFGLPRSRDARVVATPWGSHVGEAGLAGSRELGFAGPSAFDAELDGTVTILDQVNGRIQRWERGRATAIDVDTSGGLADLAVEPDGTVDVLEPPSRVTPVPLLRRFRRDGALRSSQRLSDRTWSRLEVGPGGPVVLQEPSEQWVPATENGSPLDREGQARKGTVGRPLARGHALIVDRVGAEELRVAETVQEVALRSWRITSRTPLGEVQLAEPVGNQLVVVVKTYTEEQAEYIVLVLDRSGSVQRFSVDATEWAESAPLARFRLAGRSLYHFGSSPAGVFVDRFDLEVSP